MVQLININRGYHDNHQVLLKEFMGQEDIQSSLDNFNNFSNSEDILIPWVEEEVKYMEVVERELFIEMEEGGETLDLALGLG